MKLRIAVRASHRFVRISRKSRRRSQSLVKVIVCLFKIRTSRCGGLCTSNALCRPASGHGLLILRYRGHVRVGVVKLINMGDSGGIDGCSRRRFDVAKVVRALIIRSSSNCGCGVRVWLRCRVSQSSAANEAWLLVFAHISRVDGAGGSVFGATLELAEY
jgi:hypothetical protein